MQLLAGVATGGLSPPWASLPCQEFSWRETSASDSAFPVANAAPPLWTLGFPGTFLPACQRGADLSQGLAALEGTWWQRLWVAQQLPPTPFSSPALSPLLSVRQ